MVMYFKAQPTARHKEAKASASVQQDIYVFIKEWSPEYTEPHLYSFVCPAGVSRRMELVAKAAKVKVVREWSSRSSFFVAVRQSNSFATVIRKVPTFAVEFNTVSRPKLKFYHLTLRQGTKGRWRVHLHFRVRLFGVCREEPGAARLWCLGKYGSVQNRVFLHPSPKARRDHQEGLHQIPVPARQMRH